MMQDAQKFSEHEKLLSPSSSQKKESNLSLTCQATKLIPIQDDNVSIGEETENELSLSRQDDSDFSDEDYGAEEEVK